jgi:hypothetical protein
MVKMARFRKKYTPDGAKERLEILKCSLWNYQEELLTVKSWQYSTLILALCWQTIEQVEFEAKNRIKSIISEIDYVRWFMK